jgi:hypothetical protein
MLRPLSFSLTLALGIAAVAGGCGGHVALGGQDDGGGGSSGSSGDAGANTLTGNGAPSANGGTVVTVDNPPTGTLTQATKVDLLLVVDNSASMGDKQQLLRQAVPDLVTRLVVPNCIDASGATIAPSSNGVCAQGQLEFAPVRDLHVGVITTSLGGRGGDICDGTDPVGLGGTRHDDDQAHLITRASAGGPDEHPLADAPNGFLAFGAGGLSDPAQLRADLQLLINGVHEYGCGIEAQLESWYRFLVQPDPYASIIPDPADGRRRAYSGVDATLLKQRHDFLRPDSLVAIVLLTDEDDSAEDPGAIGGQGWAFNMKRFPGSVGGGAARGTSACGDVTKVATADCTSCGFPGHASDSSCQLPGDTDTGTGQPQRGYYKAAEDTLNTRYVRMRERYGIDPQYPVSRYFLGLSSAKVPTRDTEHAKSDPQVPFNPTKDYVGTPVCTNPLFAASLPTDPGQELCNLPMGPRAANMVVFATITGVPSVLLSPAMDAAAWKRVVGNDPLAYDSSGIDVHMVQSQTPRAGLPDPSASDTADPMNGREWDTGKIDLQYACTFALTTPKDCTDKAFAGACDCASGTPPLPPLCDATKKTNQVRGKAYPGIRQLQLARMLGGRSVAASICPPNVPESDPQFGFRPALRALGDRMAHSLAPATQ